MLLTLVRPRTPRHIDRDQLTADQTQAIDLLLALLGTADGLIEDEPEVTNPAARQAISTQAAAIAGIHVSPGHEIAQCNTCPLLLDGADANEDGGRIRCDDCRDAWQTTLDDGPDTTAEARDWDY
jgi:hypothetical protein